MDEGRSVSSFLFTLSSLLPRSAIPNHGGFLADLTRPAGRFLLATVGAGFASCLTDGEP